MLQQENAQVIAEYKLIIVGERRVGKTSLVKRHLTGEFDNKYQETQEVDINELVFNTTSGQIRLIIWDIAVKLTENGSNQADLIGAHCAIIMFDVTSRGTYRNVPKWHKAITSFQGNIPIVVIGNKVDSKDRWLRQRQITFPRKFHIQYYKLSVKTTYQFEKPFLYILRRLANDSNLQFVDGIAQIPPQIDFIPCLNKYLILLIKHSNNYQELTVNRRFRQWLTPKLSGFLILIRISNFYKQFYHHQFEDIQRNYKLTVNLYSNFETISNLMVRMRGISGIQEAIQNSIIYKMK